MKRKNAFSWIWSYVRKYRFFMIIGLTLSTTVAALNMVNPIVTGRIVDKVIQGGQLNILTKLILIMICTTFVKSV